MTEPNRPISLSKARKARDRARKAEQGAANAVKFGRSRAEKQRDKAEADQAARRLAEHRRDDKDDAT